MAADANDYGVKGSFDPIQIVKMIRQRLDE
jgi:hypothetical protein